MVTCVAALVPVRLLRLIVVPEQRLAALIDVAETLQYCAEGLDEVDRAFVTTDYTASGPSGHAVDMG